MTYNVSMGTLNPTIPYYHTFIWFELFMPNLGDYPKYTTIKRKVTDKRTDRNTQLTAVAVNSVFLLLKTDLSELLEIGSDVFDRCGCT